MALFVQTNICNENAIFGCTDPIAENYNPEANFDDASCEYITGCIDPSAQNYSCNFRRWTFLLWQ